MRQVRAGFCSTMECPELVMDMYTALAVLYLILIIRLLLSTDVGLAFTTAEDIISYIREHSAVTETDTEIGRR